MSNFVSDLRSGKYDQKDEFSEAQRILWERAFKEVIKDSAIWARRHGQRSVKGYFAYYSHDNDKLRISNEEHPTEYICLKNKVPLAYFRDVIETYLKESGFTGYSVKVIDIQIWKQEPGFFRDYKWVKDGTDKTIGIEYHW